MVSKAGDNTNQVITATGSAPGSQRFGDILHQDTGPGVALLAKELIYGHDLSPVPILAQPGEPVKLKILR